MADEEPVTALAIPQPNIFRRAFARLRRGLRPAPEPEGQPVPPGWQGVPPGAPGAFGHTTSNAMESLALMGGACAGGYLAQRFQRDFQERVSGSEEDHRNAAEGIDPDLLVGLAATMAALLAPGAQEARGRAPGVWPHRQSNPSRPNDLGNIARAVGMGALSSWAMRRVTELAALPSGRGSGDGWGNTAGAGYGGPDGDGDGYGNGYDLEDGGGLFAMREDQMDFPSARVWRFGFRQDMLQVTNDDARRTERVFRCAGCIGGYECPIHGKRL